MPYNEDARPPATLLLTRPRAASERFAAEIAARGVSIEVLVAPLMEIVQLDVAPPVAAGAEIIFTSSNAIAAAGPGAGRRAWCVGSRTAEVARDAGFDATAAGACADELVASLLAHRPAGPLVHLRGRHQRGDVVERLREAGLSATSQVVYDQVERAPDEVFASALSRSPLIVPLFSPRSAELFASAALGAWQPSSPGDALIALSAAVKAAVPRQWQSRTGVAARPDGDAMIDEIARRISPSGDFGGMTRY